jgi:hypothetical protein
MAECRSCHAPVVWMRTEARPGKAAKTIPVDADVGSDTVVRPKVFPDGNLELTGRHQDGRFGKVEEVRYVRPGDGAYRTHFSSCPSASAHRRQR